MYSGAAYIAAIAALRLAIVAVGSFWCFHLDGIISMGWSRWDNFDAILFCAIILVLSFVCDDFGAIIFVWWFWCYHYCAMILVLIVLCDHFGAIILGHHLGTIILVSCLVPSFCNFCVIILVPSSQFNSCGPIISADILVDNKTKAFCCRCGADMVHVFCEKEAGHVLRTFGPELVRVLIGFTSCYLIF